VKNTGRNGRSVGDRFERARPAICASNNHTLSGPSPTEGQGVGDPGRDCLRIAYYAYWNGSPATGVGKKILGQVKAWRAQGCEVRLFLVQRTDDPAWLSVDPDIRVFRFASLASRLRAVHSAVTGIIDWHPDTVYIRYDIVLPPILRLAREVPCFVEINTDDVAEYRLGSKVRAWWNLVSRGALLRRAVGLVSVSAEILAKPHFRCFAIPSVVIGNGIDLSAIQPCPAPHNPQPRLVFVGSARQPWQGVDKVLRLAELCPDWGFDLVGVRADELGRLPPNVSAYGFLDYAALRNVLALADVAIGSLALHRIGLSQTSTLKFLDYIAHGIPTIIGYRETDFPRPPWFVLELPNTEDNVEANSDVIRAFVAKMRGQRVPRADIFHVDIHQKELTRLEFIRRVLRSAERVH